MEQVTTKRILGKARIAGESLIKEAEKKLENAINDQDWRSAAELDAYINGMNQMKIVYEMGIDRLQEDTK